MPIIPANDSSLKSLTGLHLWHAPMSSCSQRVRIVLAETGRDFESHVVALEKNEHASEAYQAIHPKGLVPALVDDGDLWIESVDIIQHLGGGRFAGSSELLNLADAAQLDLKLLTFEYLFRAFPPPPADVVETFDKGHKNEWLRQFREDFAQGFPQDRLEAGIARTDAGFQRLNEVLSDGRIFLDGDTFGLSDVAWMPNVHRMTLMGWPFERTPHLAAWFERVKERPSYSQGLLAWQDLGAAARFAEYTQKRRVAGSDVTSADHFRG